MSDEQVFPWVEAGEGVRRKVLADAAEATTARVEFQAGAVGDPHRHVHVQTIFVAEGRFEFTIEGEARTYAQGDSLVIPSNAWHGCVALEDGVLIDSFVPRRDDFF